MSFCNFSIPSTKYTGFSLETFRQIALQVEWKEGEEYEFKCLATDTDGMMRELTLPDGQCDLAIAATTITTARQAAGIEFAYPYHQGSVAIMVKTEMGTASGWSFVQPFSAGLWIAIAVTLVIWPVIIFLIEGYSKKIKIPGRDFYLGVQEATWRSLWTLEHGQSLEVTSLGARVAVIGFSFMALIIGASYTANLAAFLTIQRSSNIGSIYDLVGLATASVTAYIPRIRHRYGILAMTANLSDINALEETADLVAQGQLAAFLYDDVVLKYTTALYPNCAVKLLKDRLEPFDYGLAFKVGTNVSTVNAFSEAILKAQESGYISEQEEKFLLESSPCLSGSSATTNNDIDRITFMSVYGLWVILASGLGMGLIIMLIVRWKRRPIWQAALAEQQNGKDPVNAMQPRRERQMLTHQETRINLPGLDHSESNLA